MAISDDVLEKLNNPSEAEARAEFGIDALEQDDREYVSVLRKLTERQLSVIELTARQQSDYFWATNTIMQNEGSPDEQCRIGTRVRIVNGTFQATWYRNRFVDAGPNATKKTVLSTHLKKGKGFNTAWPILQKNLSGQNK